MTIGHLWYVRRSGAPKGPFPSSLIEKNIALGRILASDQISSNGQDWQPASSYPDFDVIQRSGQQPQVQRRLDERQSDRRAGRADAEGISDSERRANDRRAPEDPEVVARRQRANRVWQSLRDGPAGVRRTPLVLSAILLGAVLVAAIVLAPPPRSETDCAAPPAPGVNWEFCNHAADDLRGADLRGAVLRNARLAGADLSGADLREADLAYADLSGAVLREARLNGARLTGTSLRGASLVDANLAGARLDFADLAAAAVTGAVFDGAVFEQAIMPNGQVCRPGSPGSCEPQR